MFCNADPIELATQTSRTRNRVTVLQESGPLRPRSSRYKNRSGLTSVTSSSISADRPRDGSASYLDCGANTGESNEGKLSTQNSRKRSADSLDEGAAPYFPRGVKRPFYGGSPSSSIPSSASRSRRPTVAASVRTGNYRDRLRTRVAKSTPKNASPLALTEDDFSESQPVRNCLAPDGDDEYIEDEGSEGCRFDDDERRHSDDDYGEPLEDDVDEVCRSKSKRLKRSMSCKLPFVCCRY
jgi:hypothetical protein